MIYTSYFAMIRNFPSNITPVSVARFSPKFFRGKEIKNLAPSERILNIYKYGPGSQEEKEKKYIEEYTDFLRNYVTAEWFTTGIRSYFPNTKDGLPIWESNTDHIALCCYEKTGDFCHRHILAEYLSELGIPVREIKKEELKAMAEESKE